MRFEKFYFDHDDFKKQLAPLHPRYVLALDGVDEIIEKIVVHPPFSLTPSDFQNQKLVKLLIQAKVIKEKNHYLGLAVPVFIEKDLDILKKLSKGIASQIVTEIKQHQSELFQMMRDLDQQFSMQRHLYHLLCGKIFDGKMLDYLEENHLVTTSKVLFSGVDCLVVMYEKAPLLENYSSKLLCSYNRYTYQSSGFVSFGDCDGNRKDFYRYYKINQLEKLDEKQKQYLKYDLCDLIEKFESYIDGKNIDPTYLEIFEYFGYVEAGKIVVPIYDQKTETLVNQMYEFVLSLVGITLKNALKEIATHKDLISLQHEVDVKDIANEIYHLIFGEVNEQLVQASIVEKPAYLEGEGRYLKCYERMKVEKCF